MTYNQRRSRLVASAGAGGPPNPQMHQNQIPAIPAEIVRIFPVQKQIIDAIFPRNFAVFRGTETD
jgi:hypothetical protein